MRDWLPILALASLIVAAPASAQIDRSRGDNVPLCANDPYAAVDGCMEGPVRGSFQIPDFFQKAAQSGQKFVTRPPWKVYAVDYPGGIPADAFPLKDPTSSPLPKGCNFNGTNVVCSNTNDPVFEGWDFGATKVGCVRLLFNGSVTGTIRIKNFQHKNGDRCDVKNGDLIDLGNGGTANLYLENVILDGDGPNHPYNLPALIMNNSTGCTVMRRVVFRQMPARAFQANSTCAPDIKFFYIEGFSYALSVRAAEDAPSGTTTIKLGAIPQFLGNGQPIMNADNPGSFSVVTSTKNHDEAAIELNKPIVGPGVRAGDKILFSPFVHAETALTDTRGGTAPLLNYDFGTIFQPTSANGLATTALLYLSSGTPKPHFTKAYVGHTSLISNQMFNRRNGVGYLAAVLAQIDELIWDNNYWSPHGSFGCINYGSALVGSKVYKDNINFLDGSSIDEGHCRGRT